MANVKGRGVQGRVTLHWLSYISSELTKYYYVEQFYRLMLPPARLVDILMHSLLEWD